MIRTHAEDLGRHREALTDHLVTRCGKLGLRAAVTRDVDKVTCRACLRSLAGRRGFFPSIREAARRRLAQLLEDRR